MSKQTNYRRGVAVEYRIMHKHRAAGYISQRTAGSHGPFDVISINVALREIILTQVKRSVSGDFPDVDQGIPSGTYTVNVQTLNWQDRVGFVSHKRKKRARKVKANGNAGD